MRHPSMEVAPHIHTHVIYVACAHRPFTVEEARACTHAAPEHTCTHAGRPARAGRGDAYTCLLTYTHMQVDLRGLVEGMHIHVY